MKRYVEKIQKRDDNLHGEQSTWARSLRIPTRYDGDGVFGASEILTLRKVLLDHFSRAGRRSVYDNNLRLRFSSWRITGRLYANMESERLLRLYH